MKVTDLCDCGHMVLAHSTVDGCTQCACRRRAAKGDEPRLIPAPDAAQKTDVETYEDRPR